MKTLIKSLLLVSCMLLGMVFACGQGQDGLLHPCLVPDVGGHPASCLAKGTQITLANGEILSIEAVRQFDELFAYSPDSTSLAATSNVGIPVPSNNVYFATRSPSDGIAYQLTDNQGNTLVGTKNHPIITVNRGVVQMGDLQLGDTLITVYGHSQVIDLSEIAYQEDVYNFSMTSLRHDISNMETDFISQSFFANNILVGDLKLQKSLDN